MLFHFLRRFVFVLLLLGGFWGASSAEPIFRALEFDGVDDYVTVSDPIALPNGPLSIEAWIWMDATFAGGRIVSNRDGANGYEFDVFPVDGGQLEVRLSFNGTVMLGAFFTGQSERWTHVAAAWAGSVAEQLKIYVNGEQIGLGIGYGTINPPTGSLAIGAMATLGFGFFMGDIDDVRIWSVALDQATIQAWINKPVDATHPNYANLEGYWKFDEGAGQVAVSMVHSPERDGQLGADAGDDGSDPAWTTNVSPVPTDPTTLGRIKWRFR
jgi:hypothetical protein